MEHVSAYGLWPLVLINSLFFIAFAFSLFVEMYGFPLALYLLSGWLAARREERNALAEFGSAYALYAAQTPAFLRRSRQPRRRWPRWIRTAEEGRGVLAV